MENQDELKQNLAEVTGNSEVVPQVENKKKVNKLAIVFGITTLLFAGATTFFGIEYFKLKNTGEGEKDKETVSIEQNEDDEEIEALSMADEYKDVRSMMENITSSIDGNWDSIENGNLLTYKPEGLNTHLRMKFDLEVKLKSSDNAENDVNTIGSKLEEKGFSSIGVLPFLGSAGPRIDGYLDSSNNIVCGVYPGTEQLGQEQYALLECAKTDWTWLTEEEKALVKGLETAYYNKTGEYPLTLYGLDSKIKDSQYAPYQNIQVALGGGYALFYRTSADAEWQYFAGGQSYLDCSDYNTEDLKKAFAGNVCYDGVTDSTVGL